MFVEVDGDDEAVDAIKEVVLSFKDQSYTMTTQPYVMTKWQLSGDDNSPIFIDCVVTYDKHISKPRSTKHTHEVLIRENGSVFQKTIELTIKQSAVIRPNPDSIASSPALTIDTSPGSAVDLGYASSTVNSSTSSRARLNSSMSPLSVTAPDPFNDPPVITWANKVKGEMPKTFSPRKISEAGKEVIMRNRELAGSPSLRRQSFNSPVPTITDNRIPRKDRPRSAPTSGHDWSSSEQLIRKVQPPSPLSLEMQNIKLSGSNSSIRSSSSTASVPEMDESLEEQDDWTVVKSKVRPEKQPLTQPPQLQQRRYSPKRGSGGGRYFRSGGNIFRGRGGLGYERSQSDQSPNRPVFTAGSGSYRGHQSEGTPRSSSYLRGDSTPRSSHPRGAGRSGGYTRGNNRNQRI